MDNPVEPLIVLDLDPCFPGLENIRKYYYGAKYEGDVQLAIHVDFSMGLHAPRIEITAFNNGTNLEA